MRDVGSGSNAEVKRLAADHPIRAGFLARRRYGIFVSIERTNGRQHERTRSPNANETKAHDLFRA